jgi:hypothetical protein
MCVAALWPIWQKTPVGPVGWEQGKTDRQGADTTDTNMPEGIKYAKDFQIPTDFPEVLRNLTREILRDQPKDINKYGECTCI